LEWLVAWLKSLCEEEAFIAGTPPGGFAGWEIVLASTDPPRALPDQFYGWHRDSNMGLEQYNFAVHRSWDYDDGTGAGMTLWAYINPASGQFDWSGVDSWINNTQGKKRVFCFSWTPEWATDPAANKTPSLRYPGFRYGAYAPRDMAFVTAFVNTFYARYTPAQVPIFEVWNEPETGSNVDPASTNADPAMAFYADTMTKLVEITRAVKLAVPPGVQVWGGGWEGDSSYGKNSTLFLKTSDGAGGHGADHIDVLSFHPYEYSYEYHNTYREAGGYRDQLQRVATDLGKPAVAMIPIASSEAGHEAPDGYNGLASSTDETTVARGMKQMVGFAVASAIKHGCIAQVLYADKTNGRTFRGPINSSVALRAAADYCNAVNGGRVVRQCYVKPNGGQDPAVWIRFDDNTEFLA
jgi:hypothetical protein